jgi:hypothetical protein
MRELAEEREGGESKQEGKERARAEWGERLGDTKNILLCWVLFEHIITSMKRGGRWWRERERERESERESERERVGKKEIEIEKADRQREKERERGAWVFW